MVLISMLALLAYSLLERQVRQGELQMTTRCIIQKLESLDVIETLCWDGSRSRRIVPVVEKARSIGLAAPEWSVAVLLAMEGNGKPWTKSLVQSLLLDLNSQAVRTENKGSCHLVSQY
jgi:hypothetical protein